jgi:formate C-acetyltransferase
MYQFSSATPRILELREKIRDRVLRCDSERALIVTEAYRQNENVVPIIKRPLALLELCKKMTILVEDFEIIVGNKSPYYFGSPQYPEWGVSDWFLEPVKNGEWEMRDDGLYHNPDTEEVRLSVSPDDFEKLMSIRDYWSTRKIGAVADAWQPDSFDELRRLNVSSYVEGGMGMTILSPGHLIAGYKKIITRGYRSIRDEAQTWLDEHYGNLMGEDMDRYMFFKSAVIACDAGITLGRRYAEKCRELAERVTEPVRRAELDKMASSLEWIAENPARGFWEAVQLTMLYQVLITIETRIPSPSLGRFDQYIWPYLERELADGTITLPQAQEIIDAFFLKANCYYNAGPAKLVNTTGIGNTYLHTTIGGCDPDTGEDATNPVTYMVLETIGRLKLHDPTISLRVGKSSPDKLWECALETSRLVGGLPLFQNEDIIIPSLIEARGFSLRDARDFGIIGCQEIVGCGTDFPAPNGMYPPHASVWWGTIFDMAINNGVNPFNGQSCRLKTGYLYDMTSIEQVRDAVSQMGHYIMKLFITANNYAEHISAYYSTQPALSISMEGCFEKGKDAVWGGCKYNSFGGTATGLATLGDSLSTIKYMCFDNKLITTRELYDAVMANWEGYEPLRQQILNEVPHYGNADPYADMELKWCADLYYDCCQACSSVRGGVYRSGLYGASDHVAQGFLTWATPDGRRLNDPIADAISPAQSRDKNGPTAVFTSSCCFDHHHYLGGIALNLRMHPTVLSREDGVAKLRDMTKAYFESGGMEVQYNVVDTDTLRSAQGDPKSYRDLVVRIAGYSAYFVELGHDLQNDIIARSENQM